MVHVFVPPGEHDANLELPEPGEVGLKAANLAKAHHAGLKVPKGVILSSATTTDLARASPDSPVIAEILRRVPGPLAVRSSVIGEDSPTASHAGQYSTVLNVRGALQFRRAIEQVRRSAERDGPRLYRAALSDTNQPHAVAVVVQQLIIPTCAGVMFTFDPITRRDQIIIEASWGLGSAVVSGRVIPDRFYVRNDGVLLRQSVGEKTVALRVLPNGGVAWRPVAVTRIKKTCIPGAQLREVVDLAIACEKLFGPDLDIEWAVADAIVYLLQCRKLARQSRRDPASNS